METFLIKALQLILSLSILVIVHEFGHFIFAHPRRKVLHLLRSVVLAIQVQAEKQ